MEYHPLYFEEWAFGNFFALYLLYEGTLQQPFVLMYPPNIKSVIGFSSLAMLPPSQTEPERFLTGKGMLASL